MYTIHPRSPCLSCRYFINGWCALGVLDRYPSPLVEGAACPRYETKCGGCP